MKSALARRYAKALYHLTSLEGSLEAAREGLSQLCEMLARYPDLRNVFLNPVFSREDRRRVLEAVAGRLGAPPTVM